MQAILNSSPASQTLPARIGRFSILKELGSGTTGTVFLAYDPLIDRQVAIKILHVLQEQGLRTFGSERLLNEGRAAGRLCHPGIVTIFEAGHEGNVPYLVMEYLDGAGLDGLLRQGVRFSFSEIALIISRLAQALSHAHRQGVVHRDIKPANIFMVSQSRPKLLDFGIARAPNRLPGKHSPADVPYTMFDNNILGTPQYMSPEQALGQPADCRSDIYSLGVVMYEMLTGSRPFVAETTIDVLQQVARKTARAPHQVDPAVPRGLSRIAAKAMQRRPDHRYQHAHELLAELRQYLLSNRVGKPHASSALASRTLTDDRSVNSTMQINARLSGRLLALTALLML